MGWLEGVLTGYADRHYEIEKQKRDEAEQAADRQGRMFQALLQSDDPEIKAYAGAGILDLANPRRRKGGIAGWMGEIEQSPYLGMLRRAQQSAGPADESGGTPPVTPSIPTPAGQVAAPATGSAALPSTSPVTRGPITPPTPAPTSQPAPGAAQGTRVAPPPSSASVAPNPQPYLSPEAQQRLGPSPSTPPPQPPAAFGQAPTASFAPPPQPPAGPPLPVSAAPPVPPGQVSAGLPGATTGQVGPGLPVPPQRTTLRNIFPTAADLARQEASARSAGTDQGEQESWIRVAAAQGAPDPRAAGLQMWAEAQMKARGGSALQNAPMEFDVQRPDGTTARVLGWADRGSGQYLDVNRQPFGPDVRVTKAVPYSAITGDVNYREAMNNLGVHPGQVVNNPALAQRVQAEANQIANDRAGGLTTARGAAAAANPLNAQGRINQMATWQNRYNAYEAPMRVIEQNLRTMAANYAELKKNPSNEAAWEPFRVSFVHVNENSVVMPGEFARSDAIGSIVQRVEGRLKQWMEGGGPLPQDLIDDMMNSAAAQWNAIAGHDQNFRSQVEEALKDPALVGIRPEQIFGAPRPRFDPWTIAKPDPPDPPPTNTVVAPKKAAGAGGAGTVPGATGTVYDPVSGLYVPKPIKK